MQKWLVIPDSIMNAFSSALSWFWKSSKQCHKRTCMGATEEIQEDMVFDSLLRRQMARQGPARVRGRFHFFWK